MEEFSAAVRTLLDTFPRGIRAKESSLTIGGKAIPTAHSSSKKKNLSSDDRMALGERLEMANYGSGSITFPTLQKLICTIPALSTDKYVSKDEQLLGIRYGREFVSRFGADHETSNALAVDVAALARNPALGRVTHKLDIQKELSRSQYAWQMASAVTGPLSLPVHMVGFFTVLPAAFVTNVVRGAYQGHKTSDKAVEWLIEVVDEIKANKGRFTAEALTACMSVITANKSGTKEKNLYNALASAVKTSGQFNELAWLKLGQKLEDMPPP